MTETAEGHHAVMYANLFISSMN